MLLTLKTITNKIDDMLLVLMIHDGDGDNDDNDIIIMMAK